MSRAHPSTILLVEDNPDHAVFTIKALRADDVKARVVWAKDGQEALDFLARGLEVDDEDRPELILLDVQLPKVGGHEVLRRVKDDARMRAIPVIMLSTSDRTEDLVASYRAGANSYVTKPVSFDSYVERLQALKGYWLAVNELPASAAR
jgi:two-component system, response regulator